jgi:hypothetical protein
MGIQGSRMCPLLCSALFCSALMSLLLSVGRVVLTVLYLLFRSLCALQSSRSGVTEYCSVAAIVISITDDTIHI